MRSVLTTRRDVTTKNRRRKRINCHFVPQTQAFIFIFLLYVLFDMPVHAEEFGNKKTTTAGIMGFGIFGTNNNNNGEGITNTAAKAAAGAAATAGAAKLANTAQNPEFLWFISELLAYPLVGDRNHAIVTLQQFLIMLFLTSVVHSFISWRMGSWERTRYDAMVAAKELEAEEALRVKSRTSASLPTPSVSRRQSNADQSDVRA